MTLQQFQRVCSRGDLLYSRPEIFVMYALVFAVAGGFKGPVECLREIQCPEIAPGGARGI